MPEQTLAELSRAVAEKKGWTYGVGPCFYEDCAAPHWRDANGENSRNDVTSYYLDPARLYELEGELQKAGINIHFIPGENSFWLRPGWDGAPSLTEPGTAEGRARLILRAYLEAGL